MRGINLHETCPDLKQSQKFNLIKAIYVENTMKAMTRVKSKCDFNMINAFDVDNIVLNKFNFNMINAINAENTMAALSKLITSVHT